MKKPLLIGAIIIAGISGYAQNNRKAADHSNKVIAKNFTNHLIESNKPSNNSLNRTTIKPLNPSAICSPPLPGTDYSSGPNAFGVGGGITTYKQNCLSFNKDLNCMVFTHRRSATWAVSNAMGSGAIQSTWINVTTGVKDSAILYYEASATQPGRFPTGTFYNPAGNTNISNAYVVGSGPVLIGNGTTFNGVFYSTRKLTGTTSDQTMPGTDLKYAASPNNILGSSVFINTDMQQVGTKVL